MTLAACAALGLFPSFALAHDTQPTGSRGVKGMSETQLRAWERTVLGPSHAAEHATQRRSVARVRRAMRSPAFRARYARANRAARVRARKAASGPLSDVGRWTPAFDIPVFAINAALLPTGKVLWYAYPAHPKAGTVWHKAWGYLWDPSKGTGDAAFTRVDPPIDTDHPHGGELTSANIWCSGTSLLADGRVLVSGGTLLYAGDNGGGVTSPMHAGLNKVYTFNPFDETWTEQPDMRHGRWYPSQLLMPDGRTMIVQGLDENGEGDHNLDVEVFTPSAELNGVGTVTYAGQMPYAGAFYPHLFWMPSGRGFIAGPLAEDTRYFSPFAAGAQPVWGDYANFGWGVNRVWGNAVLEPGTATGGSTRILQLGGSPSSLNATNTSVRYDENRPHEGWVNAPPQNVARSHANTVLLPDGSMVTVGGGVGYRNDALQWSFDSDHKQVELWNPVTRTWRLGAAQNEARTYHSTALLLPDGRVLSAGDDTNGDPNTSPDHQLRNDTAEIYEPPYLFKGPRPTIASAPTGVGWNTEFTVTTGADTAANNVTNAVLVAPGAATHAVDMNQRMVPLQMTGQGNGFRTFRSPPNANIALPGYYMLFLLNAEGVPSVATWVRLRPGATEYPAAPPTNPPANQIPAAPAASPPAVPAAAPPAQTPPGVPASGVAGEHATSPASRRPTLSARLVRHRGKRTIRVKIGSATAPRARVKLTLRDRKRRTIAIRVRTVATGRTVYLDNIRVPVRARFVNVSLVSLVRAR